LKTTWHARSFKLFLDKFLNWVLLDRFEDHECPSKFHKNSGHLYKFNENAELKKNLKVNGNFCKNNSRSQSKIKKKTEKKLIFEWSSGIFRWVSNQKLFLDTFSIDDLFSEYLFES